MQRAVETSASALVAAAERLAPLVEAHRTDLATARDLPAPLAAALDAAGLTRLWLPRALGGAELPPEDYIRVIETLARLDGAVGWCAAIASGGSRLVAMLAPEVAATMFGPGRGFLCNVGNPSGSAVEVPGGWRVTGRWSYASFIRHSAWALGMSIVRGADGAPRLDAAGNPVMLGAFFPTASVVVHDVWNAGGLRATGSHDFEVRDAFVPAERSYPVHGFESTPCVPGPLASLPTITAFAIVITPVALGLAQAAIDALVTLAADKRPPGGTTPLRDLPGVQADVARAVAELRAARAFLFNAVGELWQAAHAGRARDIERRALVRLACWHAMRASKRVVGMMHEAAGAGGLDERFRFAACLRDVHAAGQHLAFAQRHLEVIGRVIMQMPAGTERF
jgi:alkylation response protein AidB-like acyl-CoA dehydrogenase